MPHLRNLRLTGVAAAASAADVSRQHIYLCVHGERKPSDRVREAIDKYVVVYRSERAGEDTTDLITAHAYIR